MYILQGESGYYSALSDMGSSLKAGVFNIGSFLDVCFRPDQCCMQSSPAIQVIGEYVFFPVKELIIGYFFCHQSTQLSRCPKVDKFCRRKTDQLHLKRT